MTNKWKGFRLNLLLRCLLLSIAAVCVCVLFVRDAERLEYSRRVAELNNRLDTIIAGMQSELELNTSLTISLAAFVKSNPDLTREEFNYYTSLLQAQYPNVVNMAAAPDLVISYINPLEGNEEALGLDYRTRAVQMTAINNAIRNRGVVFAGPLELVQGGQAFIVQSPVFLDDDSFWGIVSIPVLTEGLYSRAGMSSLINDSSIAIRGKDSLGNNGAVFFGKGSVFEHPDAQIQPIPVGDGYWELAGVPQESPGVSDRSLVIIGITWVVVLFNFLGFLVLAHIRRKDEQHEKSLVRYQHFLKQVEGVSEVGGWRMTVDGRFEEMTEWARKLLGIPDEKELPDLDSWQPPYSEKSNFHLKQLLSTALNEGEKIDENIELLTTTGEIIWLHLQADSPRGGDLLGTVQDVTEAEIARRQIEFQSNYDLLTCLPNRILLLDRLESEINRASRNNRPVAVCFLDVDNFKSINDTLGHEGGDRFLVELAKRLQRRLRKADTIARYSGDEFVIVMGDAGHGDQLVSILEDILDLFNTPYEILGTSIHSSASIGIAMYPADSEDGQSLILMADQAMYSAKKSGKNDWQFFRPEMQAQADRRNKLYNDLVEEVKNNSLQVHYQPIIEIETGRVSGCEALVRWQREDGSRVSPDLFIDVAEERGLISHIDLQVLKKAVSEISDINKTLGFSLFLSVNVSPRVLTVQDAASEEWKKIICSPSDLNISVEITERVLLDKDGKGVDFLKQIRNSGKGLSLDDFGTGYSGLSYITRFPLTAIKIDKSFVSEMMDSQRQQTLVVNMLKLASELNLRVVSEGVETPEQYKILKEHCCDFAQGYYLAPPMPLDQFREFCLRWIPDAVR